jgi:hypothetical protein
MTSRDVKFEVSDADRQPEKPVTPNAVECDECNLVYTGPDVADVQDDEWTICPEDERHLAKPLFVTKEPLGIGNDVDHFHHGHDQYEYVLDVA